MLGHVVSQPEHYVGLGTNAHKHEVISATISAKDSLENSIPHIHYQQYAELDIWF